MPHSNYPNCCCKVCMSKNSWHLQTPDLSRTKDMGSIKILSHFISILQVDLKNSISSFPNFHKSHLIFGFELFLSIKFNHSGVMRLIWIHFAEILSANARKRKKLLWIHGSLRSRLFLQTKRRLFNIRANAYRDFTNVLHLSFPSK